MIVVDAILSILKFLGLLVLVIVLWIIVLNQPNRPLSIADVIMPTPTRGSMVRLRFSEDVRYQDKQQMLPPSMVVLRGPRRISVRVTSISEDFRSITFVIPGGAPAGPYVLDSLQYARGMKSRSVSEKIMTVR